MAERESDRETKELQAQNTGKHMQTEKIGETKQETQGNSGNTRNPRKKQSLLTEPPPQGEPTGELPGLMEILEQGRV